MQRGVGFVRIKPIQCEKAVESRAEDEALFDPFVAVKVLDAENVPGWLQFHTLIVSANTEEKPLVAISEFYG